MAGEESEFHQSPCDIFWKIEPVEDSGFAGLQVGQRSSSSRGIPPSGVFVDTELHCENQYRIGKRTETTSTMIIPDHFSPRYKIGEEYFFIILLDRHNA